MTHFPARSQSLLHLGTFYAKSGDHERLWKRQVARKRGCFASLWPLGLNKLPNYDTFQTSLDEYSGAKKTPNHNTLDENTRVLLPAFWKRFLSHICLFSTPNICTGHEKPQLRRIRSKRDPVTQSPLPYSAPFSLDAPYD